MRVRSYLYSKVPFLLGVVYLTLLVMNVPLSGTTILIIALLAFTVLGFASVGYCLNDLFDVKTDRLVNKSNALLQVSTSSLLIMVLASSLAAILPWLWLPTDPTILLLLCSELVLFIIYGMSPLRLKERGWLGLVTDSLYAMVIPSIVVGHATSIANNESGFDMTSVSTNITLLTAYLFISGIRKILTHQVMDYDNDVRSNCNTLAVSLGLEKSQNIQLKYLAPLEMALLLFFILSLLWVKPLLASFALIALVLQFLLSPSGEGIMRFRPDPLRVVNSWLDGFLEGVFPVLTLICLSAMDLNYLFVLVTHFLVFLPSVTKIVDFGKDQVGKPIFYQGANVLYHKGVRYWYYRALHTYYYKGLAGFYHHVALPLYYQKVVHPFSESIRPAYFKYIHKPLVWLFYNTVIWFIYNTVVWAFYNILVKFLSWIWHLVYFYRHGKWHHSKNSL